MEIKFILFIKISFWFNCTLAQNLVNNGGFEIWRHWIVDKGNSISPAHWKPPGKGLALNAGTFSTKLKGHRSSQNDLGHQEPRHGNNYIVLSPVGMSLQGTFWLTELKSPLVKDSLYFLEMNVSMCDYRCVATSLIEFCFTDQNPNTWRNYHFWEHGPSFSNPIGVIRDSINWTAIRGIYRAKGGEKYLTIGSFHQQDEMIFEPCSWDHEKMKIAKAERYDTRNAWYFLDDVLVKPYGWCADVGYCNREEFNKDVFKSEFVFREKDSSVLEWNKQLIKSIVKKLEKREFSFVEICSSIFDEENNSELMNLRAKAIKKVLMDSGLEESEISISTNCDNRYKTQAFEIDGQKYLSGLVEIVFR